MKFLFAGEGGQGVQSIAQILAKAAFNQGLEVSYIPNFGVEQRGGVSLAFVIIQSRPIIYPKFDKADIAAILSPRSRQRIKDHLDGETKIILGPGVKGGLKTNLPSRVYNVLVLGEVSRLAPIVKIDQIIKSMEQRFAKQISKQPKLKQLNLKALKNEKL